MHPNADDLTALERQLAACQPTADGLNAEAMLFAAGQAAARPRGTRIVWPAIACGFAVLSAILGTGMMHERSERLTLAAGLVRLPTPVVEAAFPAAAPSLPPSPDSYLAIRQLVEQDADAWLARSDNRTGPPPIPSESPPILHAWPANSADVQP